MSTEGHPRQNRWRRWTYRNIHTAAWHKTGLSPLNRLIVFLICLALGVAVIASEPTVYAGNEYIFRAAEVIFAVIFTVEYAARVWVAAENPDYADGWRGRLRYVLSIPALIDLIALASLYMTVLGSEGAFLRLFRLARIIVLAKLGRYSTALQAMATAVYSKRYELLMSLGIAFMLLLISSTLLYMIEGQAQAEHFGSIPRAMWWSIATLTTVGYGDVYPITPLGKILAGITAITGIGLIAMPTGILAAAFSEAIRNQQEAKLRAQEKREEEARADEASKPTKRA